MRYVIVLLDGSYYGLVKPDSNEKLVLQFQSLEEGRKYAERNEIKDYKVVGI